METKASELTMEEIRSAGLNALFENLGVVGMVRFLQYTDKGQGDYTKERDAWLGNPDMDEIAREIKKMKE